MIPHDSIKRQGKHRHNENATTSVAVPFHVAELGVGRGFLDTRSVLRCAEVSRQWKSIAYRPTAFGRHFETPTADCLALIKSCRTAKSGRNAVTELVVRFPQFNVKIVRRFESLQVSADGDRLRRRSSFFRWFADDDDASMVVRMSAGRPSQLRDGVWLDPELP